MDTFSFMIFVLLIMLGIQHNQTWLVFAALAIVVVMLRNLSSIVLVLVAVAIFYIVKNGQLNALWPYIIIVLIGIALLLGIKSKEAPPEFYSPEAGYGGLLEGLGGSGGAGQYG